MKISDSGGEIVSSNISPSDVTCGELTGFPRLIQHMRNPDHILAYLLFLITAKYLDLFSVIPSISIGG